MQNLQKFYIDGQWVAPQSSKKMPVVNPATEEVIGEVILGNEEDVNIAVKAAKNAFMSFSNASKEERMNILKNIRKISEEKFDDLADAMTMEMGAPRKMSREAQADAAIGHLDGFISALEKHEEKIELSNTDILLKEPIGVCGLITPWNWPINQITLKVLPVIATGCTCILKPSEHTPLSAMVYAEILDKAGVPAGVFNLVHGDGEGVGIAMSRHPDIEMMSFTGSKRGGKSVTIESAETVKKVTLELVGKSPNLVFADCDLEEKVTASVNECMFNTGQSCDAPTRLLVEKKCYDEVVTIAKKAAEEIKVGDPQEDGDHLGPLFDKIQFDRVQNMIQVGIDEGAELLVGGLGKPEGLEKGWFTKPTIFINVNNSMRVAQEEIFGPVIAVTKFKDEAEALEIANDTEYGLYGYVSSGDVEHAKEVANRIRAGSIAINGAGADFTTPFGGYKQSGNGREWGIFGFEEFLEVKAVVGFTG